MDNKDIYSKKGESRGIAAIITIAVSALALVCCIIPAGGFFTAIRSFILGVMGVFSYIFFAALIAVSVLSLRGVKIKLAPKRVTLLISIFFVMIFAVHLFSSLKYINESQTMAEYLAKVYEAEWTAGGLITGIIVFGVHALLSLWGSIVLYAAVIIFLSLAMLDFSVFKRRERTAAVKHKEADSFVLPADFQPQEMRSSNVGSGLYVSKIQSGGFGGEPQRARPEKNDKPDKAKSRLYSDIDKKSVPPYAPVQPKVSAKDTLYGYKPPYSPYGVPEEEKTQTVLGTENKQSAYETLFGHRRTTNAQAGAFASAGTAAYNYGSFSGVTGYSGGSIVSGGAAAAEVKPRTVKPAKIVHDTASEGILSSAASLAPNDIYDSSVTPRPRNNFGEYANNPNPIISGDFFSKRIESDNFEAKKEDKYKSPENRAHSIPKDPEVPQVPLSRASIAPTPAKPEARRELSELDGKYRSGIDPRNYEGFTFGSPEPEEAAEDTVERSGAGKVISIFDDEEESLIKTRPTLRDLRPDPEISSLRERQEEPLKERESIGFQESAEVKEDIAPVEDHTGYYETLPKERTSAEKFDDKVADIEKTFSLLNDEPVTPQKREPIIRTPITKSRIIKPDNQVRLIDYEATTANPERKEPLLQPVPYTAPMTTMLKTQSTDYLDNTVDYQAKAQILENIMEEFRTPAKVIGMTVGPAVTRYELQTAQGVSVKKIEGLAQDIAYNLACRHSVRIQSPIAGRQAVGIEVPNDKIAIVALKEIIDSREFRESPSPLTFAVGKDIAGKCVVDTLTNLTHVLIAGSTGSGKSACLNSIITSLIFKSSPDDVRLILIDPKRVEFNVYNGLPHLLLSEAINEPEKAINAFSWAIDEMERRYRLFQSIKVGDIQEFNSSAEVLSGQENKLSYIVIIVDELADLMSCNKKEVEDKIRRLAQKSRAAGIHLVVATQRPSVDVVTGTIKTNLPSRIAFAVPNFQDSKIILDQLGAENLLGRGDMLFSGKEMKEPVRVQGAFVTKAEVKAIVEEVKAMNPSVYDAAAENAINYVQPAEDNSAQNYEADEDSEDALLGEAVRLVIENGQASISMVQRRFSVGYARAARLIDQMELRKYISPFEGSKPRQVYITLQEWTEIFGEQ